MGQGAVTNDTTPTFTGVVTDPDNATVSTTDTLRLEVQVKPFADAFGTSGTLSSSVNNGATASLTWTALSPGTYHWEARTRSM